MRRLGQKRNSSRKLIIGISIAVLLIATGVGAYFYLNKPKTDTGAHNSDGISTEKTAQDKQLEQNLANDPSQKQTTHTDQPTTPTVDSSTNLQQVNVVLTNTGVTNGMVSASGFVSNVVESNGTCTYVFTNGQQSIQKTSSTLPNPNSTTCKTVQFNSSELSSGTWTVQLKYSSPTSAGSSNTLKVTI